MNAMRLVVLSFFSGCGGDDAPNDPCIGVTCSEHGECVADGASARCVCEPGWTAVGLRCEEEGGSDSDVDTDSDTDCPDADRDGYDVCAGGDCDDAAPAIHPDAPDTVGDSVDQDCDDLDGVDADGDGFASVESGGDDCDDASGDVHPTAAELDQWVVEPLYDEHGSEVTLAIGSDGSAHAAFWTGSGEVRYASNERGGWGYNFVTYGESPSIALDGDDEPYVAFYDTVDRDLHLGYRFGAEGEETWTSRRLVDVEDIGRKPSLVIDGIAGQIAYEATTNGDVELLSLDVPDGGIGRDWWHDTPPLTTGFDPSLCHRPGGEPVMAIFDPLNDVLLYAGERRSFVVVDGDSLVGQTPSIACGSDGLARISYYDDADNQIELTEENADTSWSKSTVHGDAGLGAHALALDADDVPHLVYQSDDRRVWYAYPGGGPGKWIEQLVDAGADAGDSVAIAIRDGMIHAVFGAEGASAVSYAKREVPDTVDLDCDGLY